MKPNRKWPPTERLRIDVDNNNLENSFRPPAVGKRNWLFVGGEDTGQRGAILHTLLENAVRHGHNPEAWLADVLERLPVVLPWKLDSLKC